MEELESPSRSLMPAAAGAAFDRNAGNERCSDLNATEYSENADDLPSTSRALTRAEGTSHGRHNLDNISASLAEMDSIMDSTQSVFLVNDQYSEELQQALINFMCQANRLLFVEKIKMWDNFHTSCMGNYEKYGDYTMFELRKFFIEKMLPRIHMYNLSSQEQRYISLLDVHPEFKRIENGYQRVPYEERVASLREPKLNKDICTTMTDDDKADEHSSCNAAITKLQTPEKLPSHVVFLTQPQYSNINSQEHYFSRETAVLVSTCLSNDLELSTCTLFTPAEMHKRLVSAKSKYEDTGRLPINCENILETKRKLQSFQNFKRALTDVISKRPRGNV